MDDALARMQRYIEAGADMSFIEAPQSVEQMRRITSGVAAPGMANMVPGGRSPILPAKELERIGFACVAYPTALTYVIARAAGRLLRHLRANGTTAGLEDSMMVFDEFNELVGLPTAH
jgi:methylisocitrate lyase